MRFLPSILLSAAALAAHVETFAQTTIVMFRHAEKPDAGLGQLSCQGLNRALALPNVLLAKFDKPAALFAPDPGVTKKDRGIRYNYIRPLATIEPTAIRLGLPVNTQWGLESTKPLAAELLAPSHAGQTVYVAWEHSLLVQVARNVFQQRGGDPRLIPDWSGADFDSIYVLSLPASGAPGFKIEKEGLDGQGTQCPGQQ